MMCILCFEVQTNAEKSCRARGEDEPEMKSFPSPSLSADST